MCKFLCAIVIAATCCQGSISQNYARLRPTEKHELKRSPPRVKSYRSRLIQRGEQIFQANQCLDCHLVAGKGCAEGVALDGIGQRRTAKFLEEQLADPEAHVARAAKEFKGDPNLMTAPNLSKAEIDAVVAYLRGLPPVKGRNGSRHTPGRVH